MAGSISVVHVDDEPDLAEVTAEFLEREDEALDVSVETRAEAALERVETEPVDCVVSDYQMPGMDGLELLEAVREEAPDLPFVLFTGKGSEAVAGDAIARGATDYLQKDAGAEQYDILANRIRNAVDQHRSEQRASDLARIRGLVRDVTQGLLRATSREEIEDAVCDTLAGADPYRLAWIGTVDPDTDRIVPRAWAGVEEGYLDAIEITADESATGQGPAGTAIREGRLAVSQNVEEDPEFAPWRAAARERGFRATAGVPLIYEGELYGLLAVYADRPEAFDETERSLLEELGADIAHAIHARTVWSDLERTSARLEALYDDSPDMIDVHDAEGEIVDVNPRFCEKLGYERGEVLGRHVWEVDADLEPGEARELWADLEPGERFETTGEYEHADGSTFPVAVHIRRVDLDGEARYLVVSRDITNRRERERALERLHAATRDLMAADDVEAAASIACETTTEVLDLPLNGIHLHDESADALAPVAWSPGVADLFDGRPPAFPAEESLAWEAFETGTAQVYPDVHEETDRLNEATVLRSEMQLPLGDHGILLTGSRTVDDFDSTDEQLARILAANVEAAMDRVERAEELRRQNERLDEFASVVSHDLRNPLAVAAGRLELAAAECDSDHLEAVARTHDRMEELIDDLLTLSRQGETVEDPEPVDLCEILQRSWDTVETREATLECRADRTVSADTSRLSQLLANLVRNAVEHGGRAVTVTVGDLADGFYVADDGTGIPESLGAGAFEAGTSTNEAGTGFGLSIVKRIAEAHGWTVTLTASSEGGARFEFTGLGDG